MEATPPPTPSATQTQADPPPGPPAIEAAVTKEEPAVEPLPGPTAPVLPPPDAAPVGALRDDSSAAPAEALPDDSAADAIEAAPPPAQPQPPVPAEPAVLAAAEDALPSHAPPPPMPAVEPAVASARAPQSVAPKRLRVGFALSLLALGFVLGRLTAPRPAPASPPVARDAPPTTEVPSAATVALLPPAPPESVTGQPVAAPLQAATAQTPTANPTPKTEHDSTPPRRSGAAGPRSGAIAGSASRSDPIPTATATPVNSFVQAVHDDIAEDEASHKKP